MIPQPPAIVTSIPETPMARIPGGVLNGKTIKPFEMDKTLVTVAQFRAFVKATSYVTEIEIAGTSENRTLDTWDHVEVPGASWRYPEGPKKSAARPDEPVVQVTYNDAVAYADWAGKRLPTAVEFEWAQRGGLVGKLYPWGDEEMPGGKPMANYWHGPMILGKPKPENLVDPYIKIAPVAKFPPNGYGLYDMGGNAWEITSSPMGKGSVALLGGSWRCSMPNKFVEACMGFSCGTRQPLRIADKKFYGAAGDNVGFRCVRDILSATIVGR